MRFWKSERISMAEKTCGLLEQLQTIPDPRRQCRNLKHRLDEILVLAFCGTLAGCDDFVEIAVWARQHLDFLRTFLELANGIPSHDTFSRVLAVVAPSTLQGILLPWLQQRRGLPGDWVHLDGKSMRHTRRTTTALQALHIVSAWCSQSGLTLGQVAVATKSNEITALPQLLALLDVRDKIVTIDAAGCQKDIAEAVVAQGGDYILAVKDNQPTLHAEVQNAFVEALQTEEPTCRSYTTTEKGHGRQERRTVWVLPATKRRLSTKDAWTGLLSLVMVLRVIICPKTGEETSELRYFISSLRPSARRLGRAIRGHWGIENGLHWVLDVVFREDARRLYDRTAAQNVAFLNRLAVSLLRGDATRASLKVKRKTAGWNIRYLAQLLGLASD
jgi:predicted transposase YbfD/YdcC